MKTWMWITLLCLGFSPLSEVRSRHISPRSLGGFARMIKALTGRGPLEFNSYGNYCGFGGNGAPVDAIDRCCEIHDRCYDLLYAQARCMPYFSAYEANITETAVTCVLTGQFCADEACRCDQTAASCFARYKYNPENKRRFRILRDFAVS